MAQDTKTISFTEKIKAPMFYKNKILCRSFELCLVAIFLDAAAILSCFFWSDAWCFRIILFVIALFFLVISIPFPKHFPVEIVFHKKYLEIRWKGAYRGSRGCFDVADSFWYDDILFCIFDTKKCNLEFHGAYTEYWYRGDEQEPYLKELRDDCSVICLKAADAVEICRQVEENSPLQIQAM